MWQISNLREAYSGEAEVIVRIGKGSVLLLLLLGGYNLTEIDDYTMIIRYLHLKKLYKCLMLLVS